MAATQVELVFLSVPTRTFRGKLARDRVGSQAGPNRDELTHPEPVILVTARVQGADLPEEARVPADLLVTGTEVHAQVRCGEHPLGYSLFHGLWEFVCEKVVLWM